MSNVKHDFIVFIDKVTSDTIAAFYIFHYFTERPTDKSDLCQFYILTDRQTDRQVTYCPVAVALP